GDAGRAGAIREGVGIETREPWRALAAQLTATTAGDILNVEERSQRIAFSDGTEERAVADGAGTAAGRAIHRLDGKRPAENHPRTAVHAVVNQTQGISAVHG